MTTQKPRLLVEHREFHITSLEEHKYVAPVLVEGTEPKSYNLLRVKGEFARADEDTQNKRRYSRSIWENNVTRINASLSGRKLLGELDHPDDGRTRLQRVSHIITNLKVENGIVVGEAEILDTPMGLALQGLLKGKAAIGVSSRGFGTTIPDGKGSEIVNEDYKLVTFDFVADPADIHAYPEPVFEGVISAGPVMQETTDPLYSEVLPGQLISPLASIASPVVTEVPTAPAASSAAPVLDSALVEIELRERLIRELTPQLREKVEAEFLADPKVAGALGDLRKILGVLGPYTPGTASETNEDVQLLVSEHTATVEALKSSHAEVVSSLETQVAELSATIAEVTESLGQAETMAREAGYMYFLERSLGGDPDSNWIRELIGDVKQYSSVQDLKTKLESVRKHLAVRREAEQVRLEARQREFDRQQALKEEERSRVVSEIQGLQEKNSKLVEGLNKMMVANKELNEAVTELRKSKQVLVESRSELEQQAAIRIQEAEQQAKARVYAEERIASNPRAPMIRRTLERQVPRSEDEVDEVLEGFRDLQVRDLEGQPSSRQNIRNILNSRSRVAQPIDEETPRRVLTESSALAREFSQLGVSLQETTALAAAAAGSE